MKLDHDLHVHTYLSACCKDKERQTPEAILTLAEEMGVETIGFADHVWVNPELPPSAWYRPQDESQVSRLRADLAGVSPSVRVLVGCEADTIAPGKFGITPDFAQGLDFVLLACSHFHMTHFVAQPQGDAPRALARHMLAFFRSGVESGLATSIAHPLLPCGYLDLFDEAVATMTDAELTDAFGLARDRGVAIEVTTGFLPPPSDAAFSIETPIRFLTLARQAGCAFTLGTDAHDPERQKRLPGLAALTGAAGIAADDLLPLARGATADDPTP